MIAGVVALGSAWLFPITAALFERSPLPAPYVLGSALPFLPPLVAIACGHLALVQIRRTPAHGRRAAWAGLAFGYAGLVFVAGFELLFWLIVWIGPIQY